MNDLHRYYLSIGSNIGPQTNLPKAVDLLARYGEIQAVSNAWQSHPIGASGPDFMNACVLLSTQLDPQELKGKIISFIETSLGRIRSVDKNAPRPIDIDIIMVDDRPLNLDRWDNAFVVLPMAELAPGLIHPTKHQMLSLVAERTSVQTWIVKRQDILKTSIDESA
jgi:2-amino-4-hydroxy-6-hydroxymethyldihydropteridine diphosphokinase